MLSSVDLFQLDLLILKQMNSVECAKCLCNWDVIIERIIIGWFHVKSSKSENPKKMKFALFWCKGAPWGVIQESRIFFRSYQYFGFYGGLKF